MYLDKVERRKAEEDDEEKEEALVRMIKVKNHKCRNMKKLKEGS